MEKVDTLLNKGSSGRFRHVLLLSDLLAFEAILDVESSQGGHSYSLVSEPTMEQLCSFLESEARPHFESFVIEQEINMLFLQETRLLFERENFGLFESLPADILYLIWCQVDRLCYCFIGKELDRIELWFS